MTTRCKPRLPAPFPRTYANSTRRDQLAHGRFLPAEGFKQLELHAAAVEVLPGADIGRQFMHEFSRLNGRRGNARRNSRRHRCGRRIFCSRWCHCRRRRRRRWKISCRAAWSRSAGISCRAIRRSGRGFRNRGRTGRNGIRRSAWRENSARGGNVQAPVRDGKDGRRQRPHHARAYWFGGVSL